MKLFVHASIFSIVFAGFVASALPSNSAALPSRQGSSLSIPSAMPVPSCDPRTGCVTNAAAMPVPSCDPRTGCAN
jgi:hypothetical protein